VRDPAGCQTNEATEGFEHYAGNIGFLPQPIFLKNSTYDPTPIDARVAQITDNGRSSLVIGSTNGTKGLITVLFADEKYQFSNITNRCDFESDDKLLSLTAGHFTWPTKTSEDIAAALDSSNQLRFLRTIGQSDKNCQQYAYSPTDTLKISTVGKTAKLIRSLDLNSDGIDDIITANIGSDKLIYFISNSEHQLIRAEIDTKALQNYGIHMIPPIGTGLGRVLISDYDHGQIVSYSISRTTSVLAQEKIIQLPDMPYELGLTKAYPVDMAVRTNKITKETELLFSRPYNPGVGIIACGNQFSDCPEKFNSYKDFSVIDVGVLPAPLEQHMVQADFNGDGYLDLAVANVADQRITVIMSDQNGYLNNVPYKTINIGCNPVTIDARDLDSDRKLDLIIASSGAACNAVFLLRNISN